MALRHVLLLHPDNTYSATSPPDAHALTHSDAPLQKCEVGKCPRVEPLYEAELDL